MERAQQTGWNRSAKTKSSGRKKKKSTTRYRDHLRSKPADGKYSDHGSRVVLLGRDDGVARSLCTHIYLAERVAVQGHSERYWQLGVLSEECAHMSAGLVKYVSPLQDFPAMKETNLWRLACQRSLVWAVKVPSKCRRARGTERCKGGSCCALKFTVTVSRMPLWYAWWSWAQGSERPLESIPDEGSSIIKFEVNQWVPVHEKAGSCGRELKVGCFCVVFSVVTSCSKVRVMFLAKNLKALGAFVTSGKILEWRQVSAAFEGGIMWQRSERRFPFFSVVCFAFSGIAQRYVWLSWYKDLKRHLEILWLRVRFWSDGRVRAFPS